MTYAREDRSFGGVTKPVLRMGDSGPAVIVIHEVYGFTPPTERLCGWIADAGFRVYAPILLGSPDTTNVEKITAGLILRLCVSREFTLFRTGRSSPVVDWLKPLARAAHAECGGAGVGVIGMCLSGGFGLSMAVDPVVMAPVLSQPSMPPVDKAGLDISSADLDTVRRRCENDGLRVLGYRFAGDTLSRADRFETLDRELGDAFVPTTLPDSAGNSAGMKSEGKPPHSVLTRDLIDAAGEPTRAAVDEIIGFMRERLG